MKVVTRQELMQLPTGTVYSEWQPCHFGDLCIKGRTILMPGGEPCDWVQTTIPPLLTEANVDCLDALERLDAGQEVAVDMTADSRDGAFDDSMLFAVWSRSDVVALRDHLNAALEAVL